MYLTAQHLSSPHGKDGINALWFSHEDAGIDWATVEPASVVDEYDRRLVSQLLPMPPGGNRIISFLDVVGDDATPVAAVEHALRALRGSLGDIIGKPATMIEALAVSFAANPTGDVTAEYDALATAVLSVLRKAPTRRPTPLTVRVARSAARTTFQLEPDSVARLARRHPPGWDAANITVSRDIEADLASLHGDALPVIVELITGLGRSELFEEGGVVLVDGHDSRRLAEWPRR